MFFPLLLRPLITRSLQPLTLATITLTTSTLLLYPSSPFSRSPLLCDSPSDYSYSRDARTPVFTPSSNKTQSRINPAMFKQLSLGSILGLGAGLVIGYFSRTLVVLLGITIVGAQWLATKGYNVVPVERMQRVIRGVDVRSAILDNVAFKIAFGSMFALSGFAEF